MVHDFIQLERKQVIDLRDARIDHHLRVFGDGHRTVKYLGYKFFYQVLTAFTRRGLLAEPALLHDLIEQTGFLGRNRRRRSLLSGPCVSHWSLRPSRQFHLSTFPASPYFRLPPGAIPPACHCPAASYGGSLIYCADQAFLSAA